MATPTARSGLLRANLTVAAGTAISRITGVIRIIVFGVMVGQTALADAYDAANNAPNVVYELLLGGILTATLFASCVLPVPAGPSIKTGLPNRSAKYTTPAMPSSAR